MPKDIVSFVFSIRMNIRLEDGQMGIQVDVIS